MAPGRNSRRQNHSPQPVPGNNIDDSDTYNTPTMQAAPLPSVGTARTNADLNLSVLQRHNPSISHVLSIAPYAVIYVFSTDLQNWEKTGIEGTLFVCQLTPTSNRVPQDDDGLQEERYRVMVLNRRGLDNFELDLRKSDDVEITEEYVILQGSDTKENEADPNLNGGGGGDSSVIYGLWIFAEPPPSSTTDMRIINAKVIQDCARRAEASRTSIAERRNLMARRGMASQVDPSVTNQHLASGGIGYQEWHHPAYGVQHPGSFNRPADYYPEQPSRDVLGDLFRRARQEHSSHG